MQSMTGYGRGLICEDGREMTVEVKSVNHRFLDVSFRLARPIAFLDDAVRSGVAARLSRGHVELFVNYVNHRADAPADSCGYAACVRLSEGGERTGQCAEPFR